MRPNAAGQRFIAYSIFGILLLIIYQFVFMARTSANRDWNHLHNSHFTLPVIQRYALRQISEDQLDPQLYTSPLKNSTKWPSTFKKSQKIKKYRYVASITSSDLGVISLTQYAKLLVYPHKAPANQNITFMVSELHVVYGFSPSVLELVDEAKKAHKKAVVIQTDQNWVPNFGYLNPSLPVVVVDSPIVSDTFDPSSDATITLNLETEKEAYTYEYTIDGATEDTIMIGDSRASPMSQAVFFELARVFASLSQRGWQPFRTIKFVSFGHHSAEEWAKRHKRMIKKHFIAFIDCSDALINHMTSTMYSSSPLVHDLAQWALQELWDGDLLTDLATHGEKDYFSLPSLRLGANTFILDYGVPVLAPKLPTSKSTAQFLSLVISTLSQKPILPWNVRHYSKYISMGCQRLASEYHKSSVLFDHNVAKLESTFTEEFPWYQFKAKFNALRLRKVANLKMHYFEQKLLNHDRHLVFESNTMGNGTQLRYLDTCETIDRLLATLEFPRIV